MIKFKVRDQVLEATETKPLSSDTPGFLLAFVPDSERSPDLHPLVPAGVWHLIREKDIIVEV